MSSDQRFIAFGWARVGLASWWGSNTPHICPVTDAVLPVFSGSDHVGRQHERTMGPLVKVGVPRLSASFVGWLFDIVGF